MAFNSNNEGKERLLILTFDGTTNEFDDDNTNVVKIFRMLEKNRRDKQLLYYQCGIGTAHNPKIPLPIVRDIEIMVDKMVANSLGEHVRAGYKFLQQNYSEGDKVALFGFSRGAYVARGLAAMIKRVGLSQTGNDSFVDLAYRLYKSKGPGTADMAKNFKAAFSYENVMIDYLGVFDSVSSVGAFIPRHLPFTVNNEIIKRVAHAVALDERRTQFQCARWNHGFDNHIFPPGYRKDRMHGNTHVEEVFFAGGHLDVGGGQRKDWEKKDLANIALRWMIRDAERSGVGFLWNKHGRRVLDEYDHQIKQRDEAAGIESGALVLSPPTSPVGAPKGKNHKHHHSGGKDGEDQTLFEKQKQADKRWMEKERLAKLSLVELDRNDALEELHDSLEMTWTKEFILSAAFIWTIFWWFLECLPLKKERFYLNHRDHKEPKMKMYPSWWPNFFRARPLVKGPGSYPIKVHRSVKFRMERSSYRPRTRLPANVEWVE